MDFGVRGRAVIDWTREPEHWWAFTTKMTTSLAALSRLAEAEALYDEARAFTTSPSVHRQAAYATAMLYTRHHTDEHKDHRTARAWINAAIAHSSQIADPQERAFNTVFNCNGLALIEVHVRNLPRALELVTDGLAHLDRELGADQHALHRSVLQYNRAQVYAALGRLDEAHADYTAVINADPNYAEYHFDRGSVLRRLGRPREALADYERALRLSPPFPEVYHNRADTLLELCDVEGALADFDYVLQLQPHYVDALITRAGLLLELGRTDDAATDVDTGLDLDPTNPHLWLLRGQLCAEQGNTVAARLAYDTALESAPTIATAWGLRGALHFDAGDPHAALADLDHAAALDPDDVQIAFNRAATLQALGRYAEAARSYEAVLDEVDDPDARRERHRCLELANAPS